MKILAKNFLVILLIFLAISAVFSLFYQPFEKKKELSLTQVVEKINQNEIKKITVLGNKLEIIYQDETKAVSMKEPETALSQSLLNYGVDKEKLKTVEIKTIEQKDVWSWLMSLLFLLPFLIFGFFFFMIFRQAKGNAMQVFDFTRAKAKLFGPGGKIKEKVTFNEVGGLKEAKEELKEIVDFLKNPKKYLQIGARIPRGVLLMGAPGTGKTLLAKAIASTANVPFFSISASEVIELFVGVGSARIRSLFEQARKAGKAIIFIDEIDSIGKVRGVGVTGGHEEREQTLNQLLSEMDGIGREEEVLVFGASVTGDTPVLIKKNGEYKLLPISKIIDPYYQGDEERIEKFVDNLEVLGFERKERKGSVSKNNIYFGNSAFKKVKGVYRHKVSEIYEIEYLGGKIKATYNHSVFVRTQWGLKTKAVKDLKPGDILVDLPFKVNRSIKEKREIRVHKFNPEFNLELPVGEPTFEKFEGIKFAYQYALAHAGQISKASLGRMFDVDPSTIRRWQNDFSLPRVLSRNYYQHKNVLPEKVRVTPDLMRLFGYYVAEGYARKGVDFCLNRNEKEKIEDIKNLMKKIFNLKPSDIKFQTPGAVNIIYYSTPLTYFFAKFCGKEAKNKKLPFFLFEAPFDYFKEFLRGYIGGNGSIDKRTQQGTVVSVNRQLILELNWLFRMHGFKSYIDSYTAKEGRRIGKGKPLSETKAYRLGFGKTQNPIEPKKGKVNIKRPIVKSVKCLPYNGYVYDFCGCENEAFFGGESPILLHNTNRPEYLDPALLRPGRFDRRIVLDLPDINEREEILKIHCRGKPLALNVNLREVAERTPGFSGADLANVVNEAAILAARRNKHQVFQEEMLESIEKVLLGPERKSHILSKKEKEIAAYHEAGHALVSSFLPGTEPIRKISIVARGLAAGYTLKSPKEERKIKTKSEFLAEMATLLGGYCAERLRFGEITTGASNDLEKASQLAGKLVKEYGMSALGPISFGEREELAFLGREFEKRTYSEKIAAKIDKEIEKFVKNAENQAWKILTRKKNLLEKIAKRLIEKETIEREEFERLIGKVAEASPQPHPRSARIKKEISQPLPKKEKSVKVKIRHV
ncbi:MAG: AAA family ATPase [Patescibacteria group bacterium]|nr:AAA family ATPase [Patescibacteria group bacterium]